MPNSAAFFDVDRTLIFGSSLFQVGVEAWRQGLASRNDIAQWTKAALTFLVAGDKGGPGTADFKNDFLAQIAGTPVSDIDELGLAVVPKLVERVRPEAQSLLDMHADASRDRWIVSASPEDIVAPLAKALGMTGAVGTRGEVEDGIYTGRLEGSFVYGEGKVEAISRLATDRGYELRMCYAYSDSISDLPMLEAVGHPVAVNPDSELEAVAKERGWPVVVFAEQAKRAAAFSSFGTGTIALAIIAYLLGRRHGRAAALADVGLRTLELSKGLPSDQATP